MSEKYTLIMSEGPFSRFSFGQDPAAAWNEGNQYPVTLDEAREVCREAECSGKLLRDDGVKVCTIKADGNYTWAP